MKYCLIFISMLFNRSGVRFPTQRTTESILLRSLFCYGGQVAPAYNRHFRHAGIEHSVNPLPQAVKRLPVAGRCCIFSIILIELQYLFNKILPFSLSPYHPISLSFFYEAGNKKSIHLVLWRKGFKISFLEKRAIFFRFTVGNKCRRYLINWIQSKFWMIV
jgi:hypothetical protein